MSLGFRTVLFSPLVPDGSGAERVATGVAYRWRAVKPWDAGDDAGGMETQWSDWLSINGTAQTADLPITPTGNGLDVEIETRMRTESGRPEKRTETVAVPAGSGTIDFYNTNPADGEVLTRLVRSSLTPVTTLLSSQELRLQTVETALASFPSGGASTVGAISNMSSDAKAMVLTPNTYATMRGLLGAAPLASPALTGNPTAPTPTVGDNDTSIATTAFVTTAIGGGSIPTTSPTFTGTTDLVNLDVSGTAVFAPGSIAQAAVSNLTSDLASKVGAASPTITGTADFVNIDVSGTTVFAAGSIAQAAVSGLVSDIASKAPLASPALTGTPTAPNPTVGDDSTKIATTAFVQDNTAWAYGIQPRVVWSGSAWPTRSSVNPAGYTGAVEYWSPYDAAATAPTDRVLGDLWTRKRSA